MSIKESCGHGDGVYFVVDAAQGVRHRHLQMIYLALDHDWMYFLL